MCSSGCRADDSERGALNWRMGLGGNLNVVAHGWRQRRGRRRRRLRPLRLHPRDALASGGCGGEVVADGEAERVASEFLRDGNVARFGGGVGVDPLSVGGGGLHARALGALGAARHVAVEARHARDDDFASVGFVDAVADAAANRAGERKV